jgi:hypothetical protein
VGRSFIRANQWQNFVFEKSYKSHHFVVFTFVQGTDTYSEKSKLVAHNYVRKNSITNYSNTFFIIDDTEMLHNIIENIWFFPLMSDYL